MNRKRLKIMQNHQDCPSKYIVKLYLANVKFINERKERNGVIFSKFFWSK